MSRRSLLFVAAAIVASAGAHAQDAGSTAGGVDQTAQVADPLAPYRLPGVNVDPYPMPDAGNGAPPDATGGVAGADATTAPVETIETGSLPSAPPTPAALGSVRAPRWRPCAPWCNPSSGSRRPSR